MILYSARMISKRVQKLTFSNNEFIFCFENGEISTKRAPYQEKEDEKEKNQKIKHKWFVAGNIVKGLERHRISTLFHRDAHSWITLNEFDACEMAVAANMYSVLLQMHHRKKNLLLKLRMKLMLLCLSPGWK